MKKIGCCWFDLRFFGEFGVFLFLEISGILKNIEMLSVFMLRGE